MTKTNHTTLFRTIWNKSKSNSSSPRRCKLFLYGATTTTLAFGLLTLDFCAPTRLDTPSDKEGFKTYWTDTCQEPPIPRPPLLRSLSCKHNTHHVVIIGGGMAGLHTALSLAEQQKSPKTKIQITILESSSIGTTGASGLSKGLVVSGIQVPQEDLAFRYGETIASEIYNLTYQAQECLLRRIELYGIQCRLEGGGLVEASIHAPLLSEEQPDDAADCTTIEEEEEEECEELNATQVQNLLGTNPSLYKCGEYDDSCIGCDPLGLTRGLARACESCGVKIYEDTEAIEIERIGEKKRRMFRVTTKNGKYIDCHDVVLCSGATYISPKLSSYLHHAVVPIYTYMGVTEPLLESECPIPPIGRNKYAATGTKSDYEKKVKSRPMGGDDFVCLNYWRCAPSEGKNKQQILFGSLADSYPMPMWLIQYRLKKAFVQVYPQCRHVNFECIWGGPLAFSRRAVPLIGRDESFQDDNDDDDDCGGSVWYATGFGGHGIVPTVMAGSVLANAILGKEKETWRMFQQHFPPENMFWPVGRLGAQLILFGYNVIDWAHVKGLPVPKVPKPW